MIKSILVAISVIVITGCAAQNDNYQLNKKTADQGGDKEWKTFIAPLSTKTQSPERAIKRAIKRFKRE